MRLFLFANMRNERHHLDWFLTHYRRIGVTDFIIVDNGSTDGTVDHLSQFADVQVIDRPQSSFKAARCGVDWLNDLRRLVEDVTEELEYVPGWFIVNRIVRPRFACSGCETFTQAPLPSRPIERGRPGGPVCWHMCWSKICRRSALL